MYLLCMESRNGTVVTALASSQQCDLDLIPGLGMIFGLSLLLVLILAPRGFSPGTSRPFLPLLTIQHFKIPIRSEKCP